MNITKNCVNCGHESATFASVVTGHVHQGDKIVLANWCRACDGMRYRAWPAVRATRNARPDCPGCCVAWQEADGVTSFNKDVNVAPGGDTRSKLSMDELLSKLQHCPPVGIEYAHYRTRDIYVIVGSAINEATQEAMVLYRPLDSVVVFTRPLSQWNAMVEHNGRTVRRFEHITEREPSRDKSG